MEETSFAPDTAWKNFSDKVGETPVAVRATRKDDIDHHYDNHKRQSLGNGNGKEMRAAARGMAMEQCGAAYAKRDIITKAQHSDLQHLTLPLPRDKVNKSPLGHNNRRTQINEAAPRALPRCHRCSVAG
ncbi:hypothetical protein EYF80_000455 [Liparis tanakae]|uniref:Uncharacterized protein n=1 Tax=Liparis tanakae TaxID=230148 RepID=A0A4Z2JGT5_9TELE|nr:hypothetical protein EYF80_000455 [Liparis tanakae]